ncbi:glutathione peroxidase [Vibrio caribbeanicus]|uniref:glutathione peroxidase n=1 Tax=Vibrio caribbeanicus TaxID=701175 RepID=UPI0039905460
MKYSWLLSLCFVGNAMADCRPILESDQRLLNSTESVKLCDAFEEKAVLIVNTASQCGYTSQFEGLEALYQKYKTAGFTVLGFPSNDFKQDRGSEENTAKVCRLDYGVTFPMLARSSVKGEQANPVYQEIKKQTNLEPRWNFYKFLINSKGEVVASFPSSVTPDSSLLSQAIENTLAQAVTN